jgi:catechol 2,3-dioxygenase-like lactoylglutathione lyase family enzyme
VGIAAVHLFSLPVVDQDRAKASSVDVLGFEPVHDGSKGPGMRWVRVRPPGAATSITLVNWFETMAPGGTKGTVFETDDLEGDVARLRSPGVDPSGEIETAPWGRFVTFDDPDGNGLVLQETAAQEPVAQEPVAQETAGG